MSIALLMRLEAIEKRVAELEQALAARQAAAPSRRERRRQAPRRGLLADEAGRRLTHERGG